jgi:hypothetical protein
VSLVPPPEKGGEKIEERREKKASITCLTHI